MTIRLKTSLRFLEIFLHKQGWRQDQNFKVSAVLRYLIADEKCTMVPTEICEMELLAPRTVLAHVTSIRKSV